MPMLMLGDRHVANVGVEDHANIEIGGTGDEVQGVW